MNSVHKRMCLLFKLFIHFCSFLLMDFHTWDVFENNHESEMMLTIIYEMTMSHELVLRVLKASMRESCKRNFHFAVKMFLILLNACEALMFARILNFHFFSLHPRSLVPCRSSAPATAPHQSQQHVTDVA